MDKLLTQTRHYMEQMRGGWLIFLGVIVLSPDALLLRLVGSDITTTVFGRLVSFGIGTFLVLLWQALQPKNNFIDTFKPTPTEVICAFFYILSSSAFTVAVHYTAVSNALVIISATPLIAALVGLIFFKQKVAVRTWFACIFVAFALGLIFSQGAATGTFLGDLSALVTAFAMGCYFTMLNVYKNIKFLRFMLVGSLMGSLATGFFAAPTTFTGVDILCLGVIGIFILPLSFLFISSGARKISAPEVGLIMLTESIVASFWVWLCFNEVPTLTVFISGFVVIITLGIHSMLALRDKRTSL